MAATVCTVEVRGSTLLIMLVLLSASTAILYKQIEISVFVAPRMQSLNNGFKNGQADSTDAGAHPLESAYPLKKIRCQHGILTRITQPQNYRPKRRRTTKNEIRRMNENGSKFLPEFEPEP